ncbi:CPBP family intramembrane glutamic endopeptidase [Flavobacterium cerinum]|uniref:CPBP family intramembrane metalloprotease n=1 Tax=Flavobacterium cerinum TaxID=2502784 RepID=A0ABY5IVV2_9FLAO|nr:CPBP family intramembrane glutamic endopeptidase [Flavobacterium cerinum]UUC46415.1 CPBP family intramembrane metalloprotease [Flavobacterium cerinum]
MVFSIEILNRIYRFHKTLSKAKLFITAFGVLYFITTLISVIGNFIQEDAYQIEALEGKSLILVFFLLVVVAPVVETFIFQYGIIELCLLVRSKYNKQIALFVSALLFGLSHSYNIIYIVFATIMGVSLAFYYLCFRKYETKYAILAVMILHALLNGITFFFNYVLEIEI